MKICPLWLLFLSMMLAIPAAAQEITVAAASDLQPAFRELVPRFESATGTRVKVSFGSSGNISSQIQNGAPYDVFFSADVDYPRRLEFAGLVEPGTLYEYAVGRIVLWVPNSSQLDLKQGLRALLDRSVSKIAIANPQHAPYGRAAVAALRSTGIYEQVQSKFVLGENVSQAAQFVQTGNADAGIVALSLALSPAMQNSGRYAELDAKSYPAIRQGVVALRSSKNKQRAQAFLEFIKGAEAQSVLKRYGLARP